MNVKYFAALREITGKREEQVELGEDSTMGDLVNLLVGLHGAKFENYVMDEATGTPKSHLLLLIDGTSINSLKGMSTKLSDGCVVAMMPPVGGG